MEESALNALRRRVATLPGGRDCAGRPVLLVVPPAEGYPAYKHNLNIALRYLLNVFSETSLRNGLVAIVDAEHSSWRVTKTCVRQLTETVSKDYISNIIVLRPDAFWDKQRVENCTKASRYLQAMYIPRSRLCKYVDSAQLPEDLGGDYLYNHERWIQNRLKVEEFIKNANNALMELENLRQQFQSNCLLSETEVDQAINTSADMSLSLKENVKTVVDSGKQLLHQIEYDNRNRKYASEIEAMSTPQDILDTIEKIEQLISALERKQIQIDETWFEMERNVSQSKCIHQQSEGITRVINWILGPGEMLLNSQHKVGFDVLSAEELRREHESLELRCCVTYGQYAELMYKIDNLSGPQSSNQYKDLISQRYFMDYVCRSFALRLEKRRNLLITSLRFFRLVSEYFDRTSEVFESLVMGNKIDDFKSVPQNLRDLRENQVHLDCVEEELVQVGNLLTEQLQQPVKDALGRNLLVDYSEDVANVRDILDATIARRNIFTDSVDLQKLTLEKATHVATYEADSVQAIQWLNELYQVLYRAYASVGCDIREIQIQKNELQAFQETAKGIFDYGCQLLNAALTLRLSCKMDTEDNVALARHLRTSWRELSARAQEQMTRLRVCTVFHRTLDAQCAQIVELRDAVGSARPPGEDAANKRVRVRGYLENREQLLVEVGRMVRLGRLLKTRLREPLCADSLSPNGAPYQAHVNNESAIEAISTRLADVTELAEQLDMALRGAQQDCALNSPPIPSPPIDRIFDGIAASTTSEDWHGNKIPRIEDLKSDDEFLSASECTAQSRSSSFHTASECRDLSPWWELDRTSDREDLHKEKMVLAVGLPDLPNPKCVLKPSPEVPPGKIAREVTETTHLKVQHCHTLGVSSYVLTSETVRELKSDASELGQVRTDVIQTFDIPKYESVPKSDQQISYLQESQALVCEPEQIYDGSVGEVDYRTDESLKYDLVSEDSSGKETIIPVSLEEQTMDDDLLKNMTESGDWIQLKILEIQPELTTLGETLERALELQKAHDDVLLQLQSKQSPVEELLRQADQLISTQRPRAEVYAAMADSLGKAWKDVNFHLELRKQILDLNVLYHLRADECKQRMRDLEAACGDADVPVEIDAVKSLLTNLHDLRRAILESLMTALQQGNLLLAKLKELAAEGTLDSRPEKITASCKQAIAQVEKWLEDLHDKRRQLDISWQTRKTQLEQCLALALLASDLREVEEILVERRTALENSDQLGDSVASSEILLNEHKKLRPEAKDLQERAIKITKATEQLVSSGCFASEPAITKAYTILENSSDYIANLDAQQALLSRVLEFFNLAHTALTTLNQIEVELTTNDFSPLSPQLSQLHEKSLQMIEEITEEPLKEGHSILDTVGRGTLGSNGIKNTVEELENRKIYLQSMCTAHKEENRKVMEALNNFLEQQGELNGWLLTIAEAFLQGHQDMGSNYPLAKDFLDLHAKLLSDIQIKGTEINTLLLSLPPVLEFVNESQRKDVDSKVEALHDRWVNIKNILEARLDLGETYAKFHSHASEFENEVDTLEDMLKRTPVLSDEVVSNLEEKWEQLKSLYRDVKYLGEKFIADSDKVSDTHLDLPRAILCIQTTLERLRSRQLVIGENWESWQTSLTEKREVLMQWESHIEEATTKIDYVTKIELQLYPIITSKSNTALHIASDLEDKLGTLLPKIKQAQNEIEHKIKETEILTMRTQNQNISTQTEGIKNKLIEINHNLQQLVTNYEIILEMLISYFKNISEMEKTIDNFNIANIVEELPDDFTEVERLINEHEASKRAVTELFKFAQNEAEQIIPKIRKQEPQDCAEHDIEKMLYILKQKKNYWEISWEEKKNLLEQHRQLCYFDSDLHQINDTLNDLSRQLSNVKGQYGESLAGAKATSLAFVYFEKTIEILEDRIAGFVKSAEQMLEDRHVHSPHIEYELKQLQERWADFRSQVHETRRLIDLSIEYFKLVDEADEWFREGSKLLMTIARKATTVKQPQEATELLNEVEMFLKPGEIRQDERIHKISALAVELYGIERSKQVTQVLIENNEMLSSFSVIRNELHTLELNLKAAEKQKEQLRREQAEVDANLEAAKAEATAARAAASAAEEARKAAEAAAKALREATYTVKKVEIIEMLEATPIPPRKKIEEPEPELQKAKIIEELPEPEAPKFTVPLANAVVQEGNSFTFECRVIGFPLPIVTWYKDGISIQNNLDYKTTFDQGICTLSIEETFAEDSARYSCKAINAAGSDETAAILSINETEPEEQMIPPSFIKTLEPGIAKEGSTFKFECKITGNPLPTVQWFKNKECIDNSPDYVITYNNGDAMLKFEEVFLEDKAEYTCKANNPLGNIESSASLSVEPLEPTESPSFPVLLLNVMARAGKKVKLECQVSGIPQPTISWSFNGKPIRETHDVKLHHDEKNRLTLTIAEAFPKDAGVYVVTASNLAGEATSACNVTVKGRLPNETSDSEFASDMEPIKPSFQLPLKDQSVFEGKKVRLDCVIIGQPEPEVIWYHDERPVKESTDFQLLFLGDKCSLVIDEAYLDDAGEYKVVAINSAGEAASKCNLSVLQVLENDRPTRGPVQKLTPQGTPPMFSKLISDVLVPEKEKVVFECCVQGDPKPEIKWYVNNEEILPKDRISISSDDQGNATLVIDDVCSTDKGVYTVKACNASGDAKCFAQLIVKTIHPIESPKKIEKDTLVPIKMEPFGQNNIQTIVSQNATESRSSFVKHEVTVHSSSSSSSHIISNNTQPQVHSMSSKSEHSFKQINQDAPEIVHAHKVKEFHQKSDETPVVKEHTFISVTKDGHTDEKVVKTDHAMIVHKRKSTAPRFVSPLIGKIVDQESDVVLEGILDGFPSPEIKWFKNGNELKPKERAVDISWNLNHAKVELHSVTVKDAGRYTCTATNEAGTASCTADLVVKKTIFPPVFGRRLQAQVVKKGDRVNMEVEVTGTPEPAVTWYKNGEQIVPGDSEYRLKTQGNCHSLIIDKATMNDMGKFMVRAINTGGEAQSIADFAVFEPTPDTMIEVVKTVVFEDIDEHEKMKVPTDERTAQTKQPSEVIIPVSISSEHPLISNIESNQTISSVSSQEYSTVIQNQSQKIVSFKMEHTMPDIEFPKPSHHEQIIPIEIKKSPIDDTEEKIKVDNKEVHIVPIEIEKVSSDEFSDSQEIKVKPNVFIVPVKIEKFPSKELEEDQETLKIDENEVRIVPIDVEKVYSSDDEYEECEVKPEEFEIPIITEKTEHANSVEVEDKSNVHIIPVEVEGKSEHTEIKQIDESTVIHTIQMKYEPIEIDHAEIKIIDEPSDSHVVPMQIEKPNLEIIDDLKIVEDDKKIAEKKSLLDNVTIYDESTSENSTTLIQINKVLNRHHSDILEESEDLKSTTSDSESITHDISNKTPMKSVEDPSTINENEIKDDRTQTPEESLIDTSSITKQNAYDFFKNKIDEAEEPLSPVKIKPFTKFQDVNILEQTPLTEVEEELCLQTILTRGSDPPVKKMVVNEPETPAASSDFTFHAPLPVYQASVQSTDIKTDTTPQQIKSSTVVTTKTETHSSIMSGFNLIPEPPPEIGYMPKDEQKKTKDDVAEKVKKLEENHKELSPLDVPLGAVKIIPTKIKETSENVLTKLENKIDTKIIEIHTPVYRPQADIIERPLSPRPSAEAIEMEKLWIPQKPETLEFSTVKQSSEIISEKQWSPYPIESDRPLSETSSCFSTLERLSHQRPHSSISTSSEKPSAEGIAMDKIWAHKHPESNLQKSWPPQQEEDKIQIPWTVESSEEKQFQTKTQYTEVISKTESFNATEAHKSDIRRDSFIPVQHFVSETEKAECSKATEAFKSDIRRDSFIPVQHFASEIEKIEPSKATEAFKSDIRRDSFIPVQHFASEIGKTESFKATEAFKSDIRRDSFIPVQHFASETERSESSKAIGAFKSDIRRDSFIPVQHYISESVVSHISKIPEQSTSYMTESKSFDIQTEKHVTENIIEERNLKPSLVKKSWPPNAEHEIKPTPIVKPLTPKTEWKKKPILIQDDIYLEPGPAPEIGYAEPPQTGRRQSYVEIIEENLEKNLEKEPTKVLPGAVRTIPPPKRESSLPPALPPRNEPCPPPPLPAKPMKTEQIQYLTDSHSKYEHTFTESNLRSSYENTFVDKIKPQWRPFESDTEDNIPKRNQSAFSNYSERSRSTEPQPLPPSAFEKPLQLRGPSQPLILDKKESISTQQSFKHSKQITTFESKKESSFKTSVNQQKQPSPPLKPGSPPKFMQAEPPKQSPESPKMKPKMKPESGYMADTDEPLTLQRKSMKSEEYSKVHKFTHHSSEKISESKNQQSITVDSLTPKSIPKPHHKYEHKVERKNISSSLINKEYTTPPTIVKKTFEEIPKREERDSSLEPFPFKPEAPRPKRTKCPPPPSPSKFVKGEFRESDFESDYDGRIPPVWRPSEAENEPYYKPVQPILTPTGKHFKTTGARSPTPPSQFDNPPQIIGPPRPKFEPIEKHKQTVKKDEYVKSSKTSQILFKPKPVIPTTPKIHGKVILIQPGPAPEISFAPSPKQTQYYTSTTKVPFPNATQTETSNFINLNESTERSHRVVNIQQTTKVIKFGDRSQQVKTHTQLEPFPFKPEPERIRRYSGPAPPTPTKFIPGEFRETDYESEIELAKIKPKWTPGESDTDEPRFRKVRPPTTTRCSSVPVTYQRVKTPMEFDTQPPLMPTKISTDISQTDGEYKKHISNVKKQFKETKSSQQVVVKKPQVIKPQYTIKPGSPPKYGFIPAATATNLASKHMSEMTNTFKSTTQKFVDDIMMDVNKNQYSKPILKPKTNGQPDSDAQVYREENRVAEHGPRPTTPSTPSTPGGYGKTPEPCTNPPLFITPLKDIAVLSGQTARFECIVQSEPTPNVLWSRNGRIIPNSVNYQMQFRNGVCRLTIPRTYLEDAGSYNCTATNPVGSASTMATLQVSGERRSSYI